MSISITTILVQNITLLGNILLWHSLLSKKEITKAVTKVKLNNKGDCVFRGNGPLLYLECNYADHNSWSCNGRNWKN